MDDQQKKSSASIRRLISGGKNTGSSSDRVAGNQKSVKKGTKKPASFMKRLRRAIAKRKYRKNVTNQSNKPNKSKKAGGFWDIWANSRMRAMILGLIALIVVLFVVLIAVGAFDSDAQKAEKAKAAQQATEAVTDDTEELTEEATEVETTTEEQTTVDPDARTVYFTFNGGPSEVTESIMDVLDSHHIKGTFFVRSVEENADLIKKIKDRGHVIGVLTAADSEDAVYADMDSFQNDVNTARQFIYQQTGVLSEVYRFPGGSYYASYNLPIDDCRNFLNELDMRYFDWNVESFDNEWDTVDAEIIADNILNGIHAYEFRTNVVLLEDGNSKTTTADALEIVIPQLEEEGFGFAGLSSTTPEMTFDIE